MILYTTEDVTVQYFHQPDPTVMPVRQDVVCARFTKEHIPEYLYIQKNERDTAGINVQTLQSLPPVIEVSYILKMKNFKLIFEKESLAIAYFNMFLSDFENKNAKESFPELFL